MPTCTLLVLPGLILLERLNVIFISYLKYFLILNSGLASSVDKTFCDLLKKYTRVKHRRIRITCQKALSLIPALRKLQMRRRHFPESPCYFACTKIPVFRTQSGEEKTRKHHWKQLYTQTQETAVYFKSEVTIAVISAWVS